MAQSKKKFIKWMHDFFVPCYRCGSWHPCTINRKPVFARTFLFVLIEPLKLQCSGQFLKKFGAAHSLRTAPSTPLIFSIGMNKKNEANVTNLQFLYKHFRKVRHVREKMFRWVSGFTCSRINLRAKRTSSSSVRYCFPLPRPPSPPQSTHNFHRQATSFRLTPNKPDDRPPPRRHRHRVKNRQSYFHDERSRTVKRAQD